MPRPTFKILSFLSTFLVVAFSGVHALLGQEWPDYVDAVSGGSEFRRGPGFYLSWWKLASIFSAVLYQLSYLPTGETGD